MDRVLTLVKRPAEKDRSKTLVSQSWPRSGLTPRVPKPPTPATAPHVSAGTLWAQPSPGPGGPLSRANSHPSVGAQANLGFARVPSPAGESRRQRPRGTPRHWAPPNPHGAPRRSSSVHSPRTEGSTPWEGYLRNSPHPYETQGGGRRPLLKSAHPAQLRPGSGGEEPATPRPPQGDSVIGLGHGLSPQPREASHLLICTAGDTRSQVRRVPPRREPRSSTGQGPLQEPSPTRACAGLSPNGARD